MVAERYLPVPVAVFASRLLVVVPDALPEILPTT
jgi:hypothetical protein